MTLHNIKKVKYIKLGNKGVWEKLCIEDGTIRLDYCEVPHELGLNNDKEGIKKLYINLGVKGGAASNHARQVLDFYNSDENTLWIMISNGYLWWAQSKGDVEFLGNDKGTYKDGSRLLKTINGWSNKSLKGDVLNSTDISGLVTKSVGYQGTICDIKDDALNYVLNKINGEEIPEVLKAKQARAQMLEATIGLIKKLTWQDFELFVDLLFSHSGWRRISSLGATQKTIDIELELPITGERAIVQIKSQTDQKQLDEYVERLTELDADKYFYVYHTEKTKKPLNSENSDIELVNVDKLAEMTFQSGLVDWLIKKVG